MKSLVSSSIVLLFIAVLLLVASCQSNSIDSNNNNNNAIFNAKTTAKKSHIDGTRNRVGDNYDDAHDDDDDLDDAVVVDVRQFVVKINGGIRHARQVADRLNLKLIKQVIIFKCLCFFF